MNLQSYFESCLFKRKNLRLPSSLPHVSVRFSSPALCMQQCTQSTSQCLVQTVLSNKSSFSLARYTFSSACFLPLLSRYSEPLPARHYQCHCCASVPHQGTAGTIPVEGKVTSDFLPLPCTDFTDCGFSQDHDLILCLSIF